MADKTTIEWADATWNPITGCSQVSPGCRECYAMILAAGRLKNHPSRRGLTVETSTGPKWNGVLKFNFDWLTLPFSWKKPRRIFVCAHSDLFHEHVPADWIDLVMAVVANCPRHQFLVLTKRAQRMQAYMRHRVPGLRGFLPNLWLGVSVETQQYADERIPLLLETPAAVRWISAEPLLGEIDLYRGGWSFLENLRSPTGKRYWKLDWVVAGGESGPRARPMHPDWARSLRDQCSMAGVPFFFKQWGEWAPWGDGRAIHHTALCRFADGVKAYQIGKKASARVLDSRTHDDFPETAFKRRPETAAIYK